MKRILQTTTDKHRWTRKLKTAEYAEHAEESQQGNGDGKKGMETARPYIGLKKKQYFLKKQQFAG